MGVVANTIIGYYVDMFLYTEPRLVSTILSGALYRIISVAIFILGYKRLNTHHERMIVQ